MSRNAVERIANAVLYEGYMLYPYRPSAVKNRQRWNFGVVYPASYAALQTGSDSDFVQTECLVTGNTSAQVEIRIRFLQLIDRSSGAFTEHEALNSWQEAVEHEVALPLLSLHELCGRPVRHDFRFLPERQECEDEASGEMVVRQRELVTGLMEASVVKVAEGVFRLNVTVRNTAAFVAAAATTREQALMQSLVSTHAILHVQGGIFISLLDPPEAVRDVAARCKNVGSYPVLVGEQGMQDTMLASPIILYDYPEIAPESAGDLFDGTEIDEILSLRIMTMTDEEKREMRQSDERSRRLLERTENLSAEQLMKLHGTLRELRPLEKSAR